MPNTMEAQIIAKLEAGLAPTHLEVRNDSHKHAGHQGSPNTGASHFHVTIHSAKFTGLSPVNQQRLVYRILAEELKGGVHALSMELAVSRII